jgi:antitoxin HicB
MAKRKFTVFLLPDKGVYSVLFPYYSGCITDGDTVEEALKNAKEAMELYLEVEAEKGGDPVPSLVRPPYVVVSEIEVEVPDRLIGTQEEAGQAGR